MASPVIAPSYFFKICILHIVCVRARALECVCECVEYIGAVFNQLCRLLCYRWVFKQDGTDQVGNLSRLVMQMRHRRRLFKCRGDIPAADAGADGWSSTIRPPKSTKDDPADIRHQLGPFNDVHPFDAPPPPHPLPTFKFESQPPPPVCCLRTDLISLNFNSII